MVFNPPDTPHMGGSWERLMGSVKKILKPSTNPSDEVFEKFVDGVWNIVNTRPLTYRRLLRIISYIRLNWWRLTSRLFQCLRKKWKLYQQLATLTRRTKWSCETIKGRWRCCDYRREKSHQLVDVIGKNDQVYQVIVQTAKGILTRPAVKLAILDVL